MQQNQDGYYEIVRRHFSLSDTTTALNQLSHLCKGNADTAERNTSIGQFQTYLKKQNLTPEFNKIILKEEDFKNGDFESISNKVMAYVLYRIQYYAEKNEKEQNKYDTISSQYLFFSTNILTDEKYRADPKYFLTLLSFLLNYSRGLIDDEANFIEEFNKDMKRLTIILDEQANQLIEIDNFMDEGDIPELFRDAIKAFRQSLKSQWAKEGLESYLASVELNNTIEEVITTLDEMPIYLIREKFGINGMVCFGYILLSISELTQGLDGSAVLARVFVCLWHEASHYLLRTLCKDFLATSPRGNGDLEGIYSTLEGGYRLERFLFGTYQYVIWKDGDFSNIVKNRQWDGINIYKKIDFKKKTGLKVRYSQSNSSGMEMATIIKSSKE